MVRTNKENLLGIEVEDGKLVVPVVQEILGYLMGSGIGAGTVLESVDYDIKTTDRRRSRSTASRP
jgi:hypothetical protein